MAAGGQPAGGVDPDTKQVQGGGESARFSGNRFLQPREVWVDDPAATVYERDGRYTIAWRGQWLPGNYDSAETALAAVKVSNAVLHDLEQRICHEGTGEGQAITAADLP